MLYSKVNMKKNQTSTPKNTPHQISIPPLGLDSSRRQFTPFRNDMLNTSFPLEEPNDDEAERTERRKSVALTKSLSQLRSGNASSPMNYSGIALSTNYLKSHLHLCTKLYAENKINTKNAWTLKIIDVLAQIVAKNEPDTLQVVTNSLDIAARVYGLRVDDLHAEGLRFAAEFGRNFPERSEDDDGEDGEDIHLNGSQQDQQKKKKQKKRRALLAGRNKQTLNANCWKGTLPKLESVTFSVRTDNTASTVGNFFTNKIRMDPAGYKFMFLSKEKGWQWTPGNDPSVKEDTNKKFPIKIKRMESYELCTDFKDFRLDEWDPDEENTQLPKKATISHRLEEVVLDDDGIPIPELDGSFHDVFQDRIVEGVNADESMEEQRALPFITEFRPFDQQISSTEISEYSLNTLVNTCAGKVEKIWAGPSHWKLKCIRGVKPVYTGRDEQVKKKKKGTKKKIEVKPIDLTNLKPSVDFSLYTKAKASKRKSRVADELKITLPSLDPSCAELLKNIRGLMTVPSIKPAPKQRPEEDCDVSEYKYDNPNDSRYIPKDAGHDDDGADLADDYFDNNLNDNIADIPDSQEPGAAGPSTGMSLIEAPIMVPQSYVPYAKKAKRMDMKKLKQAVWSTLTHTPEYDSSAEVVPMKFSQMYKELPERLTREMKRELSCPMAFVSLLHLCNEQNLELKQRAGKNDFEIFGPPNDK